MTFSQRPHHTNLAIFAEAGTYSSPSCPNQPRSKDFKYPMREFGKTKVVRRSFQDNGYDSFSWLDYDESNADCYICQLADSQKKLCNTPLKEPAFIKVVSVTGKMPLLDLEIMKKAYATKLLWILLLKHLLL